MITFSSTTYLRDVNKYKISMIIKNNIGISIKKVLEINKPFLLNEDGELIKIIDNNYYVLEIIPFDKNYVLRVHLDYNYNVIERYYFMTTNNGINNGVLVYCDLKLAYICSKNNKKIYNQDKLEVMKSDKKISTDIYEKTKQEMLALINEIDNKKNSLYNIDYKQLIIEGGI